MEVPTNFKLDVRVRERMLGKGAVTEAEVQKHLEGLADLEGQAETIELAQPAVTPPGERPPVSARPAPRPAPPPPPPVSAPMSVPPPALPVDEGWGDDEGDDDSDLDEEDEDEDEDEDTSGEKASEDGDGE